MKLLQYSIFACLLLTLSAAQANAGLTYSSSSQSGNGATDFAVNVVAPLSDSSSVDVSGNTITYTLSNAYPAGILFFYTDSAGANRAQYNALNLTLNGKGVGMRIPGSTFTAGSYLVDDLTVTLKYDYTDRYGVAKYSFFNLAVNNLNLPFSKGLTKVSPEKLTVYLTGKPY